MARQHEELATRAIDRVQTLLASGRTDRVAVLAAQVRRIRLKDRWLEKKVEYVRQLAQLELAVGDSI